MQSNKKDNLKYFNMNNLLKRNYDSTVKRGKITDNTRHIDFIDKIFEEYLEFKDNIYCKTYVDSIVKQDLKIHDIAIECTDIILTCLNYLVHSGYNPIELMEEKISINEKRND